jgi:CRP/FNR family cyclic AMP-dependent transcriptional regulator
MRALLDSTSTPFAVASYERNAVIFLRGDACDNVMHIETGLVRLAVTSRSGHEAISDVLGAAAFLGEEGIGGHDTRDHTAMAMIPTTVLVIAKAEMVQLLRTEAGIRNLFMAHLLARQTRLEADLTDQLLNSSERRLARRLVTLAGYEAGRPCACVLPQVSQELIAEMVGTTRTRVNLFLGRFKKRGFIERSRGTLRITPALVAFVHDDPRDLTDSTLSATA